MTRGTKYNFENMQLGERRLFRCKKSECDWIRNSLQTSARSKGIYLKTNITEIGVEYYLNDDRDGLEAQT